MCKQIDSIEQDTTLNIDIIKANGAEPQQNLKWMCVLIERYPTAGTGSSPGSLDELFETGSSN
jgi:hypothetical protein